MATRELYSSTEPDVIRAAEKFADSAELSWPPSGDPSFWHSCAPDGVRLAYDTGDLVKGWKLWRRHLRRHKRAGNPVVSQLGKKGAVAALIAGDMVPPEGTRPAWLLALLAGRIPKSKPSAATAHEHAASWLAETAGNETIWSPTEVDAWEAIVWTYALRPLARSLDAQPWWQLVRRLHCLSTSLAIALDDDPLAQQLAAGELRWTLACMLPELSPCRKLAAEAKQALSVGFAELLDGCGVPHAQRLRALHPLVACWIRCRLSGKLSLSEGKEKSICWDDAAEQQFPLAIQEMLRLSRHDGTPVLCPPVDSAESIRGTFTALQHLTEVASDRVLDKQNRRKIRGLVAARRSSKASKSVQRAKGKADQTPEPSIHSEWAHLATLATDWSPRANRLAVAYDQQRVRIDLQVQRKQLLSGTWEFDVQADGMPALSQGSWSEICWVNDADCDYLELELQLTGGLRLQRQMLLARHDEFLYLADALVGAQPQELSFRSRLPLAGGVLLEPAKEIRNEVDIAMGFVTGAAVSPATRELVLVSGKPRAMALPLALPEWRSDSRGGSISAADGSLELQQAGRGRCLYAPLWLDLSPKRFRKTRTWRQLTVAEQLVVQPRDVAVGYRIQFADSQWLVYRALTERGNRTVLGQNLSTEFLISRFKRDGETETILEVE